jgi:hypothetical protein
LSSREFCVVSPVPCILWNILVFCTVPLYTHLMLLQLRLIHKFCIIFQYSKVSSMYSESYKLSNIGCILSPVPCPSIQLWEWVLQIIL